jgi:hypothetical protein
LENLQPEQSLAASLQHLVPQFGLATFLRLVSLAIETTSIDALL